MFNTTLTWALSPGFRTSRHSWRRASVATSLSVPLDPVLQVALNVEEYEEEDEWDEEEEDDEEEDSPAQ